LISINTGQHRNAHAQLTYVRASILGRLTDKVLPVTGGAVGAVGAGAACADRMIEAGAKVAIVDLQDEAGRTMSTQHAGNVCYLRVDVPVDPEAAAANAGRVATIGRLDVLIKNAGNTCR
jgi:NADP-dependent 3-hydroxy acid dehydrogenase YdfG